MKKIILIIIFIVFLFIVNSAFASLKLNEIYPAPPSGEYEWVELYNDENQTIDISQYQLLDFAGNKIKFSTQSALPFDFILATSSSVLNNTGDTISLKNNLEETIEIATYSGTFDSNKTFAKCPNFNGNWFILNLSTKNTSNQTACQSLTPTPTITPTDVVISTPTEIPTLTIMPIITITTIPTITPTFTPAPTPIPQSYDDIYLSEAMVNPTTGEKEWVEIYNNNDFPVYLNNWYIDDLENAGSSPKIFSLEINAKGYGIVDLTSSMFNNDGDSIRLLDFNKNLKDSFEYSSSIQGKTFGRISTDNDNFCLQEPSKNYANNPCINPTPIPITPTPTIKIILSSTKKDTPPDVLITKANNFDVSIHRSINYPTGVILSNYNNGDVLGITSTSTNDDSLLIRCLTFVSVSYSLLTISSILFKMKLSYGKNKNFYSSPFHSS